MNHNIEWTTNFLAIDVIDEGVIPNFYTVRLSLRVNPETSATNHAIAFERIKCLIDERFSDGILVAYEDDLSDLFFDICAGQLIVLPDYPHDQVVGMALFSKINAIVEGNIIVDSIQISSAQGNNLTYTFSSDSPGFTAKRGSKKVVLWWDRPDLTTFDVTNDEYEVTSWEELGLMWEVPAKPKKGKKSTKPVATTPKMEFVATVVDGGRKLDD